MPLALLSFHINSVGVDGLSRLSIPKADQVEHLRGLVNKYNATEGFYLGTCNRIEYIFAFKDSVPESLPSLSQFQPRVFIGHREVAIHLLEVALSKDSVVFGESQIMGQIKDSLAVLTESGLIGRRLNKLFNLVLREAKAIRSELGLSHCHTSVSTVAARRILHFVREQKAPLLLVGAGESNQIIAKYLLKRGFSDFVWANRTAARAQQAALDYGGRAISWEDFLSNNNLPEVAAISIATDSGEILLRTAQLNSTKPKIVSDISVPANSVKDEVLGTGAEYLDLDQINLLMKAERQKYEELVREMDSLIVESTKNIVDDWKLHLSAEVLSNHQKKSEEIYEDFLKEIEKEMVSLDQDDKLLFESLTKKLVRKLSHSHLEELKTLLKKS